MDTGKMCSAKTWPPGLRKPPRVSELVPGVCKCGHSHHTCHRVLRVQSGSPMGPAGHQFLDELKSNHLFVSECTSDDRLNYLFTLAWLVLTPKASLLYRGVSGRLLAVTVHPQNNSSVFTPLSTDGGGEDTDIHNCCA